MTDYPRIRVAKVPPPRVRLRVLPALLPLNVEMQATATEIQWRVGDGPWQDLIALSAFIPTTATLIVTAAGAVSVPATIAIVALNKASPSATSLLLPSVASRAGLSLTVVDFAGNGGDVTLTAAAGETIMGQASTTLISNGQGMGMAASVTLFPSTGLAGWLAT